MSKLTDILSALSDESRLRTFLILKGRELCVCQIVALLGLATSTVSKHLSILKGAGLISSRKHGRWVYYMRDDKKASAAIKNLIVCIDAAAGETGLGKGDFKKITNICSMDLEKLCKTQREN